MELYLKKPRSQTVISWALVFACVALVGWIRTVPLSLLITEDWAEGMVRNQLREKIARDAVGKFSRQPSAAQIEILSSQWIEKNKEKFKADVEKASELFKSEFSFKGRDGRRYVYLGDYDSYVWLRNARNYLNHGTTCDAVVNGECRDTYGFAPVGSRMIYNRSLHIAAIVGLHRVITFFKPEYPLAATSFWVPVIIGILGVLPAFFIGRRLGGNMGGLFAATVVCLHPFFLVRSVGSDNDVWNVVLPLFALWAVTEALSAKQTLKPVGYGLLAGGFTGLHATVWRGWLFFYVVILSGMFAQLLLSSFRYGIKTRSCRFWRDGLVQKNACVLGVYYLAAALFTTLAGSEERYFAIPVKLFGLAAGVFGQGSVGGIERSYWPDAFITVRELLKPDPLFIAGFMGGRIYFVIALLGLLLMFFPGCWRRRHFALFLSGVLLFACLFGFSQPSKGLTFGLLALPLAAALLLSLFDGSVEEMVQPSALPVLFWFLAAFHEAYSGLRFLLLLIVPYGLGVAVVAGRLYDWLSLVTGRLTGGYRKVANALLFAFIAGGIIQPVRQSYMTDRAYLPAMNAAWGKTLVKIRDESRPDAIINLWWDYGYWAKYFAGRRVSNDGASLRSHVPHWIGKALVTPSEKESVGILRMLNCGSDAMPWPEGKLGAYGKILATGRDELEAYSTLSDLVKLSERKARMYLAGHGFTELQQKNILSSTHCVPPESFLIIDTEQIRKTQSWMHLGSWDLRKAFIVERARFFSQKKALAELVNRLGFNESEALRLYSRARELKSEPEAENFVAPRRGYLVDQWLSCARSRNGRFLCPIAAAIGPERSGVRLFSYDPESPKTGKLLFYERGRGARSGLAGEGNPAVIVVADGKGLDEASFSSTPNGAIGILLDLPNQRILVGSPVLVRSTFVQLAYLDGRSSKHFKKFFEAADPAGDRVIAWRIRWDGS